MRTIFTYIDEIQRSEERAEISFWDFRPFLFFTETKKNVIIEQTYYFREKE